MTAVSKTTFVTGHSMGVQSFRVQEGRFFYPVLFSQCARCAQWRISPVEVSE